MTQFIIRRLILFIPALLGILLITFVLARLIPGDPCVAMLGERATPAQCDAFRERFGLNDSVPVQFMRYMTSFLQGDFGDSIRNKRPVGDILLERLPMTLEVTMGAMLFSTIFGVYYFSGSFWSTSSSDLEPKFVIARRSSSVFCTS